jgi:phytoene/squalene synthetase
VEDYNDYCHYVAGLVGIGLSQLFGEQRGGGTSVSTGVIGRSVAEHVWLGGALLGKVCW